MAASTDSKAAGVHVRKAFIGGNWKSNGTTAAIQELVAKLNECTLNTHTVEVVVAPTFLHLSAVKALLRAEISAAAQNCSLYGAGAYTGEVHAAQLKDAGINWVILGHSERRQLYKESDKDVGDKVKAALNAGLNVIACVGETLAERNATQTLEVVTRQLKAIADGIPANVDVPARVVIAYEPVWAIGTGQVATPAQAQAVHRAVREWMKSGLGSAAVANAVRVIYGGSVSKDNCDTLMVEPDIDGFLVGGASLKAADFCHIMQCPARQIVSKKPSAAAAAAPSAAAAADPK